MKNVQMTVEGHKLTITVDFSKEFGLSASGKTIIISSTEASVPVSDRQEKVGLNVLGRSEVGPFHTRPPRQCSATWTCSPGWRRRRPSCRVWHDAEGGHDGWTRQPSHRSRDIRGVKRA